MGSKVKIIFSHEEGLFYFNGEVGTHEKKGNIIVYKLFINSKIIKIQRREYFRFSCTVPVNIRIRPRNHDTIDETDENQLFSELTRNISGGGLGFVSRHIYAVGETVELAIDIEGNIINTSGEVLRCQLLDKEENLFEIGIVYKDIKSRDRDTIIKFIFNKQIKLIQKGML